MAQRPVQCLLPLTDPGPYVHSRAQASLDGFVIDGEAYETVVVTLTSGGNAPGVGPTFLEVERSLIPDRVGPRTNPYRRARIRVGLADLKRLKKHVKGGSCDGRRLNQMRRGRRQSLRKIVIPAELDKEVTRHLQRLQRLVDPVVLQAQTAAYKATRHFPKLMQYQEFDQDRFLVGDVIRYRAACVAVLYAPRLAGPESVSAHHLIPGLRNWRAMLSPTGKSYRAFNVTLDQLPGSLPVSHLLELRRVKLPRPIRDRTEFLLITTWSSRDRSQRNFKAFTHSRRPEIEKAMAVVSNVRQDLSPNRIRDVRFFVSFLIDSRRVHLGGITGLARKAVEWHIGLERRRFVQSFRGSAPLSTKLAEPPIPLPRDPRVRFLSNLADLANEAAVMKHCVASYARRAVAGTSFLFHVSCRGDEATVEVNPRGKVVQARGPRNRLNRACRWGESYLRQWGSAFPTDRVLEEFTTECTENTEKTRRPGRTWQLLRL